MLGDDRLVGEDETCLLVDSVGHLGEYLSAPFLLVLDLVLKYIKCVLVVKASGSFFDLLLIMGH